MSLPPIYPSLKIVNVEVPKKIIKCETTKFKLVLENYGNDGICFIMIQLLKDGKVIAQSKPYPLYVVKKSKIVLEEFKMHVSEETPSGKCILRIIVGHVGHK